MSPRSKDVTEAELAILQVLWDGPATIREITDAIYPGGTESHYATVKKLLSRIEEKGFIERDRSQIAHRFSAVISQDDLIGHRLQNVAEDICEGSHMPLLMNLLTNQRYSARERRELSDLFDELFKSKSQK